MKFRLLFSLSMLFAFACEDQGCAGLTPLEVSFPEEEMLTDAVVAHLSDQGMTELETLAPSILSAVAGFSCDEAPCPTEDGLCDAEQVCRSIHDDKGLMGTKIAEQVINGSITVCTNPCSAGDASCEADFFEKCNVYVQVDEISFSGTAEGDLEMGVLATLFSSVLPISYDLGFLGDGVCDAQINRAQKLLTTTVSFDNSNPLNRMRIIVGELNVELDDNDVQLCPLIEAFDSLIWGLLETRLREELDNALEEALSGILYESCADGVACPAPDLTYCGSEDDICRFTGVTAPETGEPMRVPLATGIEGRFALDEFANQFLKPGTALDLAVRADDVSVPAAATGTAAHTLNIKAKGGFRLPETLSSEASCVPQLDAVAPTPLTFEAPLLTAEGEGYDFLMAVSKNYMANLAETLRTSGALCQTLDEAVLTGLSSGALSLLLPSLDRLTNDASVPLQVDVTPKGRVEMEIGRNLTSEDVANPGRYILEEPLLGLKIDDLDLDMYLLLPGGWVRFLTVRVDLYVDLSLQSTETGGLTLLVGDASNWIQDVTVLNSGLLEEEPEALEESLPSLVSVFLPGLLDSMELDFELPAVAGVTLSIDEIAGTNESGTTQLGHAAYDYMGIFASMTLDPDALSGGAFGLAANQSLHSWAAVKEIVTPDSAQWRRGQNVVVHLAVDATNAEVPDEDLVTWVKIDQGQFHPLYRGKEIAVIDPVLNRPGTHNLQVFTAIAGLPATRDPVGVSLPITTQIRQAVSVDESSNLELVEIADESPAGLQTRSLAPTPAHEEAFSCASRGTRPDLGLWGLLLAGMLRRRRSA